jgi:hypothetical protein
MVNTGATAGAAVGPAAFGLVASTVSLGAAWTLAAVAALVGGVLVMASAPHVRTSAAAAC